MRAVMSKDGGVFVVDTPMPAGDGVLITVTNSGICGSDLHTVALGKSGVIIGHEFGGYTEDGQLVAVRPTGECGHCRWCITGAPNRCAEAVSQLYGGTINGGLADYASIEVVAIDALGRLVFSTVAANTPPAAGSGQSVTVTVCPADLSLNATCASVGQFTCGCIT